MSNERETRRPLDLGAWLVDNAPRGEGIDLPPRSSRRGDPFEVDLGPSVSQHMEHLTLVPPEAGHYAFALSLYLETMQPYTSELMVWDEGRQRASFAAQWRPEDVRIVMRGDRAVGWLQFRETNSDICLQQFFIAPRRMGIGTDVLKMLLTQWRPSGKPVVLNVLKNNPARRLYERFGFEIVGEAGVKYEMRLQP